MLAAARGIEQSLRRPPQHPGQPRDPRRDPPRLVQRQAVGHDRRATRVDVGHRPPSQQKTARGRRRPDPLVDFLDAEVVPMLKAAPEPRAIAIFAG